jgi:beta-alanine degradation protein BauB
MDKTPDCCETTLVDADRRLMLAAIVAALGGSGSAAAQDAAVMQPSAYRVVLENDKLRVLEFNSRPGMGVCGSGVHSHPPHLTVVLSAAKARVKLPGSKTFVAAFKPGDVFWSEAETHEVENISGKDIRSLLVELKSIPGAKG